MKDLFVEAPFLGFCLFSFLIIILILFGYYIVTTIKRNKPFNIHEISLDEKWVGDAFKLIARQTIEAEYDSRGKSIKTQKGQYRADYIKDQQKYLESICSICCNNHVFSDDFCRFCETSYSDPRRKDLVNIIFDFLNYRQEEISHNHDVFLSQAESISPDEFFEVKKHQTGDIVGVYIIHNESKDMYYVGQAKRLFFRINQHFTGHGNGDLYADYKYGDDFAIKIIPLADSGYQDLDLLEKDLIKKYDAYNSGYNRTSGNH